MQAALEAGDPGNSQTEWRAARVGKAGSSKVMENVCESLFGKVGQEGYCTYKVQVLRPIILVGTWARLEANTGCSCQPRLVGLSPSCL
jgi:hypothetical protein